MKTDDSDYICNALFGSQFDNLKDSERDVLNNLNFTLLHSQKVNEYDSQLDSNITQVMNFEEPDLLIISSDIIYAIEHFRVDASRLTNKGTTYRRKYNKNYTQKINSEINTILETEDFALKTEEISTSFSYENLYKNVIINFDKHYAKVEKYKKNILTKLQLKKKKIHFFFFVQYDCIFPSYILTKEHKMRAIFPDNDIKLIEYCKDKIQIDGIFFSYNNNSNNNINSPAYPNRNRFLLIENENLNNYQLDNEITYDFTKIKVLDFQNPTQTTVVAKINKS